MAEHTGMSPQYLELSERRSTPSLAPSLAAVHVSLLGPLKSSLDHSALPGTTSRQYPRQTASCLPLGQTVPNSSAYKTDSPLLCTWQRVGHVGLGGEGKDNLAGS